MAACEVCGNEEARYVCSNCNKRIGLLCFSREGWLCATCAKLERPDSRTAVSSRKLPLALSLLAFIMIVAGYVLLVISAATNGQGSFVVVFPFFFASSGGSGFLFIPALILTALIIVLAYLSIRRPVRNR